MTTKSTRRAAEQAVINEAVEFIEEWRRYGAATTTKLSLAVSLYQELPMANLGQPAFSNNSTDTSAEAGASMLGHLGKLAHECYSEIAATYRDGGLGLTVDAIEQRLVRSHQSVSARVNELRDKGWVVDSGVRRPTRSGRKAIVWRPTSTALSAIV